MHYGTDKKHTIPFYVGRATGLILLIALASVFFFSGYSKIYTDNAFDSFQWTFIDIGITNMNISGVLARFMISSEFFLGLMLLFHVHLRKFTYPAVIFILSFFIVYLFVVILKQGNTGNCGCFGDKLAMKPLDAIWKNLIMIAVTIMLMFIYPANPYKERTIFYMSLPLFVAMLLGMVSLSTPYVLDPDISTAPAIYKQSLDLNLLYKYAPVPDTDLRKGKHIIAFMSLTCVHCRKTAYLMNIIHRQHPEIPFYLVLDGPEPYQKKFFDETHAEAIPHLYYKHGQEFMQLAGKGVPAIYWVNNGIPEYKSTNAYYQLDPSDMEKWLHGVRLR